MPIWTTLQSWREHLAECWTHAKRNRIVIVATAICTGYSIITTIKPFVDLEPQLRFSLPKLPLPWAVIIVLAAIIYILIEGGYRLRQAERAKYEAELAKYVDNPAFSVERHAEGILTYARHRKAERQTDVKLMFCKKSLQPVMGDTPEKLEEVMEHLIKSGHAMKANGYPDCWYID